MKQELVLKPAGLAPAEIIAPDESISASAALGWLVIILFFGFFGVWSVLAPLNGAVVATGVVKVQGNRKAIQHLDGGIVRELRVKEGQRVNAGDVLVELDDTQARAEYKVLLEQFTDQRAAEERLQAEFKHSPDLRIPADLRNCSECDDVSGAWDSQVRQFLSRRTALDGNRKVIDEKIAQLNHQVEGAEGQLKSYRAQLASVQAEMTSLNPLLEKGLITRPRYLQLERNAAALEGQAAETAANIARTKQATAEQMQQILQLDNDRTADVAKELRETQERLLEIIPKLMNARAALDRTEIRSPYSGQVVGLSVFAVGAVIQKGEKILDVVPDRENLIVEAQVPLEDIAEVKPGMKAHVQLPAYKQRTMPVIGGDVLQVSADRLTDSRTGAAYYVAEVVVDGKDLDDMPNVKLYPGMPANVLIPTVERTALDYLVGPLFTAFSHSFRQR